MAVNGMKTGRRGRNDRGRIDEIWLLIGCIL